MSRQRNRVKGLANIGALISRAPEAVAPPAEPKGPKITQASIVDKTMGNLKQFINGSATDLTIVDSQNRDIVIAAVREAFNLGHAAAVGQDNLVEELLEKQYDARTSLTMPAVVAGVMEQTGSDSLVIDLDQLSTVFTRCRLEYDTLEDIGHANSVEYRLIYRADDGLIS